MFDLPYELGRDASQPLRVVALGAHADDADIGAGGTILRLLAQRPHTHVWWAVLSGTSDRLAEARAAAGVWLADAAAVEMAEADLPDGLFPQRAEALRSWVRDTLQPVEPHLVLTHRLDDAHQDHRAVAEVSWQTFRGATIAGYEIPKWEGDLGRPNSYVILDDETAARKVDVLASAFPSQTDKGWYDADTFRAMLRMRGVEAGVRWAEAFHCDKLVW